MAKIGLTMKHIKQGNLSVEKILLEFVNNELLPGTNIDQVKFWLGFDKTVHELAPINKKLLSTRDEIQKKIDKWHIDKKDKEFDPKIYENFLREIGYLVKEGENFSIETKNVDSEICNIAGPQLVVPVMNARYSLNAANARWGSLYNALYGTDVISESDGATRGEKYNYIRGERVIEYARNFLDYNVPLANGSWKDIQEIPKVENNQLNLKLKNANQFVGYNKKSNNLSSLLFKNNNLHIDVLFDLNQTRGGLKDKAAIYDVILESAITSIMDHEDSVAAVDAEDKVHGYRNWLGLMKGDLKYEGKKNTGNKPFTFKRELNPDREYISPDGSKFKLHGRALMLNRNVGHLMTNSSILLSDGSEIPEGIMDAFITTIAAVHDFKNNKNSRTKSFYIVKPKMHGPDEVAFTNLIFEKVEELLNLEKFTIKIGIMDEERRTTLNLKECIRAVKNRVVFINTGFLDRTGDEMHTSMEAGPMIKKGDMKSSKWISAYENNNVDIGLACGFSGIAQIGKGMWAAPDKMADMMSQKIIHPKSGANCAWVPSPTAATLHAMHYHQVDVFSKQKELKGKKRSKISDLLTIPTAYRPNWSVEEITKEIENNAQSILGYVVRWIDQGVGCSKVPDINNVGLMEDRATLRISSQHIANWLHHGICKKELVLEIMKKMAKIVDKQNIRDPDLKGYALYKRMSDDYDTSIAFKAACDLIFKGRKQPSGYTEPILHLNRLLKKN